MNYPKFGNKYGGRVNPTVRVDPTRGADIYAATPERKRAVYVPHGGTAKEVTKYTGGNILGIGTMHKSNAVPVFSQEEAEDISKMRRG